MYETYYFCLDPQSYRYAEKHLANGFVRVFSCYSASRVGHAMKMMKSGKGKEFYMLRKVDSKYLKTTIQNMELLAHAKNNVFSRLGLN